MKSHLLEKTQWVMFHHFCFSANELVCCKFHIKHRGRKSSRSILYSSLHQENAACPSSMTWKSWITLVLSNQGTRSFWVYFACLCLFLSVKSFKLNCLWQKDCKELFKFLKMEQMWHRMRDSLSHLDLLHQWQLYIAVMHLFIALSHLHSQRGQLTLLFGVKKDAVGAVELSRPLVRGPYT